MSDLGDRHGSRRYTPGVVFHFIFFVTFEWAQAKLECLSFAKLTSFVQYNTLAYWAYLQVKKKKYCEYGPYI